MTKKLEHQIRSAINELEDGLRFLDEEKTKIVRLSKTTAMPADSWTSGLGQHGIAIEKQIGSPLCYLRNARQSLLRIVTPVVVENEV